MLDSVRERRMRRAIVTAGALAAVSPGASPASATPAGATAAPGVSRAGARLALVPFRMEDNYGRPLTMSADGVITGPKGPWGRGHLDGTVTYPDGSVRGRLLPNGRVVDARGSRLATISSDGTATMNKVELRFDAEGRLRGGDPANAIRLIADQPEARRIAMLVFVLTQLRP